MIAPRTIEGAEIQDGVQRECRCWELYMTMRTANRKQTMKPDTQQYRRGDKSYRFCERQATIRI
jgi:hypothetical protein